MNSLKCFVSPSGTTGFDRIFKKVELKCRELELLKSFFSFFHSIDQSGEFYFYHQLVSLASEIREQDEPGFSSLLNKFLDFLSAREHEGLAYFYSFFSHNKERIKDWDEYGKVKIRLVTDLRCSPGALKILFVDDSYSHLRLIHKKVTSYNQFLEYLTSPEEALEKLDTENPGYHVVISDYRMPGSMSGIDFLRKVRKIRGYENRLLVLYSSLIPRNHNLWDDGIYTLSKEDTDALVGLFHWALQLKNSPPYIPASQIEI